MAAPAIGRRSRWAPPAGAALDWEHPLSQGLVGWWTHTGADLMGLLPLVPTGISHAAGVFGRGAGMTTTGASLSAVALPAHRIQPPATVVAVMTKTGTPTNNTAIFGVGTANGEYPYSELFVYSVSGGGVQAQSNNAGTQVVTAQPALAVGPHVIVATFTATNISVWVDGQRAVSTALTVAPAYAAASRVATGGYQNDRTGNFTFHAGSLYNRVLSPVEIAALYADPYCMLRT